MKNINKIIIVLIISLSILLLSSCSQVIEKKGSIYAMKTYIDITLYSNSKEKNNNAYNEIEKIYKDIHKLADNKNEYPGLNNTYVINNTNEKVVVNDYLFELLSLSNKMLIDTNGYYNHFMGNLIDIYKDIIKTKDDSILSNKLIDEELKIINQTKLVLNKETKEVQLIGEGKLDLGAIAKGYATKLAREYLINNGFKYFLINAGNSSISLGEKVNDESYKVGINSVPNFILKQKNIDISTSSINEQKVLIDDKLYHHIINPKNGKNENYYDVVTILGEDSGHLDALSTAIFNINISLEEELDVIKHLEIVFDINIYIFKDGKKLYSTI